MGCDVDLVNSTVRVWSVFARVTHSCHLDYLAQAVSHSPGAQL